MGLNAIKLEITQKRGLPKSYDIQQYSHENDILYQ